MKGKISVEGIERDIVPVVCQMSEKIGYEICYSHESPFWETPYKEKKELLEDPYYIVKRIVESGPDLIIICNAKGYLSVLKHYSETTDIPLLVVTGGGPGLIDEVKEYTPHVLEAPFGMKELHGKLEEILR